MKSTNLDVQGVASAISNAFERMTGALGSLTAVTPQTFPSWARNHLPIRRPAHSWPDCSLSHGRSAPIIPEFEEIALTDPDAMSVVLGAAVTDRDQLARQVIRMGPRRHHVGYFPSRLNNSLVSYESSLEHDGCLAFEADPSIKAYRAQPVQLSLRYCGGKQPVYPDFELTLNDGSITLLDVKPESKTHSRRFRARTSALMNYTRSRGMGYALMTDEQLRALPLPAIRYLVSMSRGRVKNIIGQTTWAWLKGISPAPDLDYVMRRLGRYPAAQAAIAGWILDGDIEVDLYSERLRDQVLVLALKQSGRVPHV